MICKEKEKQISHNKLINAGQEQELDVAFYLRREFKNDDAIFVFNDIKFKFDGETAQIDHLIIHPYGFIIIESKSITGNIVVNEHGEWSRSYNDKWYGISSPIIQAKLQAKVLRELLSHHRTEILGKMLGIVQAGFGGRTWECVIAISSNAIINRKHIPKIDSDIIVKSEFIPESIRKFINNHKKESNLFNPKPKFSPVELENICEFITKLQNQESKLDIKKENIHPIILSCSKCGKIDGLTPRKGQYGYYVACSNCKGNTALKRPCPSCSSKSTSVHLSETKYLLNCGTCNVSIPNIIQDKDDKNI